MERSFFILMLSVLVSELTSPANVPLYNVEVIRHNDLRIGSNNLYTKESCQFWQSQIKNDYSFLRATQNVFNCSGFPLKAFSYIIQMVRNELNQPANCFIYSILKDNYSCFTSTYKNDLSIKVPP